MYFLSIVRKNVNKSEYRKYHMLFIFFLKKIFFYEFDGFILIFFLYKIALNSEHLTLFLFSQIFSAFNTMA